MTLSTRWIQRTLLAAVVTGTLGFGAAAAGAAPSAKDEAFFCGIRPSGDACRNCCLGFGYNDGGYWNPDNGRCWCRVVT
jgi:uncharacterized membrane protein YtjA (UPF0391 family)